MLLTHSYTHLAILNKVVLIKRKEGWSIGIVEKDRPENMPGNNNLNEMNFRLDSIDRLLAEDGFEQDKILENVADYYFEQQVLTPYTPALTMPMYHQSNSIYSPNTLSPYSPSTMASPEGQQSTSPSSCCSRPESAYSSASSDTWYPSDCPPSTSSSTSSDSNAFHFPSPKVHAEPDRPKRAVRRTRTTPPKSPVQPATRGRGRPMKGNDEGDQTIIRKRMYAREYRKKNQKTHDELFACLMDMYTVGTKNGIDFSKMFPQHKKVISEIVKTLK